jgi:hypothetical protein
MTTTSRSTTVKFEWADGEHEFCLPLGQLRDLQKACDAGPRVIFDRLASGRWLVDDIYETIRLGLIGGGMAPLRALGLVNKYVAKRPLIENVGAAMQILEAELVGVPDDPVPKSEAGESVETTTSPSRQAASSPSPESTDGARSSDTRRERSTSSPYGSSEPSSPAMSTRTRPARKSRSRLPTSNIGT